LLQLNKEITLHRSVAKTSPSQQPAAESVVLRTRGLTKHFGDLVAVHDLNLELYPGEVFGFLGPNGSGKSTTVGMLLGLIRPTAGTIEAFGIDMRRNPWPALRRIGAIVEQPAFYPYLSGHDNLKVIARAIGGIARERISEVLELVGLAERANDRYDHYSLGMKQRLGIASTLLRDPGLIILDEPTNGLDPAGTREVRDLIPRLAHEGRTVFLCSHLLHEVEQVCDRVAIIKQGHLLAQGSVDDLLRRGKALQLRAENIEAAHSILKQQPWVPWVERNDSFLIIGVPADDGARVNETLAREGIYLSELRPYDTTLENIFLELTGEA
jgi:ABC-2 type transport system ATP-binding protein